MLIDDVQSTNLAGDDHVSSAIWVQSNSESKRIVSNLDSFLIFAHTRSGGPAQWQMVRDKNCDNNALLGLLAALYDYAAKEKLVPTERAWGDVKKKPTGSSTKIPLKVGSMKIPANGPVSAAPANSEDPPQ